jgi:glutamine amidotransferase
VYAEVIRDPKKMAEPDLVVLPGVGAAGMAMETLEKSGMAKAIRERHQAGRPILGICLGAQLLCDFLCEGNCPGFGWITSRVEPFKEYPFYNNGWCGLNYRSLRSAGLARALTASSTFFFNHRYVMGQDSKMRSVALEGRPDIPAVFLDEAICAVQFHPEKSQRDGQILLRNILEDHFGL